MCIYDYFPQLFQCIFLLAAMRISIALHSSQRLVPESKFWQAKNYQEIFNGGFSFVVFSITNDMEFFFVCHF